MGMNLLLAMPFVMLGVTLTIIGLVYKTVKENKLNRCTEKIVGEVVKYSAKSSNVWLPIVEFDVDDVLYRGKLV